MALDENRIFKNSFLILFKDKTVFYLAVLMTVIYLALSLSAGLFVSVTNLFYLSAYTIVLEVIIALIGVFVYGMVISHLGSSQNANISSLARQSKSRFFSLLGTLILYSVIVSIGLVAFIVPGIYLLIRLFASPASAVLDKKNPIDALSRSWHMTQGHGWEIFITVLMVGIVLFLISAAFDIVGISFISEFFGFSMIIASVLIYNSLSKNKKAIKLF